MTGLTPLFPFQIPFPTADLFQAFLFSSSETRAKADWGLPGSSGKLQERGGSDCSSCSPKTQGHQAPAWQRNPDASRAVLKCSRSDRGALCHTNTLTGCREKEYCILGAEPFLTVTPILTYQYRHYRAGSCPYFVLNYAINFVLNYANK